MIKVDIYLMSKYIEFFRPCRFLFNLSLV